MLNILVRAEGNCPNGYYPIGGGSAGWEGCAPIGPGAGAGDSGEPEPQLETRWGAIATTDGALGVSKSKNSQSSAEQQAMSDCQAQVKPGGKPCVIRLAYYNQCAAVAWGDGGSLWARSADVKKAESMALANCKNDSTNCEVLYSACSYAERAQ